MLAHNNIEKKPSCFNTFLYIFLHIIYFLKRVSHDRFSIPWIAENQIRAVYSEFNCERPIKLNLIQKHISLLTFRFRILTILTIANK